MRDNAFILLILTCLLAAVLLLCALAGNTVRCVNQCNANREAEQRALALQKEYAEQYEAALNLLRNGNYREAKEYLWRLPDEYRNKDILLTYAIAGALYTSDKYYAYDAYARLDAIPTDYAGDLADEIAAFRKNAEPYRAEKKAIYDAEEQRLEEMLQQLEEQKKKWDEEAKVKAGEHSEPYVGMYAQYIDYTQLGRHTSMEYRDGVTFYYWKKGNKSYSASVQDGYVVFVGRTVSGSSGHRSSSDPYNASDYSHVDDFYYDHRDDFFNYQDAEDYYDEHYGD